MKKCIFIFVVLVSFFTQAQRIETAGSSVRDNTSKSAYQSKNNVIKFSLSSLIIGNIHLQYERILNHKMSVALGYSTLPESLIPFQKAVKNLIGDKATNDKVNEILFQYSTITPEVRFYMGKKGYGKGFYLAPFYRNAKIVINGITLSYSNDTGTPLNVKTKGSFRSNTLGLLAGSQFNLGKSFVLDWWIIGPHYGRISGSLEGENPQTFSDFEQSALRSELSELDFPIVEEITEVTNENIKLKISSPWVNVRAGLCIGYRF